MVYLDDTKLLAAKIRKMHKACKLAERAARIKADKKKRKFVEFASVKKER